MRQRRLLEKLPLLFLLLVTNPKGCRSCWEAGFYLPNGRDQTAKLASPEIPSTLKKSNVRTSRTPRLIAGHIFRFLLKHVVCRSALGGGHFLSIHPGCDHFHHSGTEPCVRLFFLFALCLHLFAASPAPTCALLFQLHLIRRSFPFDALFFLN